MKIGITSDWHFCQFSSIVRGIGKNTSVRLEHLVDSINWAENLFKQYDCYAHICLGDAFDKSYLNAEEISALNSIKWSNIYHYFLVGNHEMATNDLRKNSANLFDMLPNCTVISHPTMLFENIFVLPYILESNRKPLAEYLGIFGKPRLILSHNDIKGIQFGSFISKEGFSIEEIKENCGLFLNGHLHNMGQFSENGWNVGNLCGQNFNEDAMNYSHCAWVLDTDTGEIQTFENPYALNFYKIDFSEDNSIEHINEVSEKLKKNAVCTIKCLEEDYDYINARFGKKENDLIPKNTKILESRILVERVTEEKNSIETLQVDHLSQFDKFVKENIGTSETILSELKEVLA